tara:strand:- start:7077 stop:7976 length:900 start_codon:yes stop_codon:yes gene_type:complete
VLKKYRKMQEDNKKPFPFLELPQELRDMVYEYLIEDPSYPTPPKCPKHASAMNWMLPGRWSSPSQSSEPKSSNWILLANKQIYTEYMDLFCKRATFHLTVSPHNYQTLNRAPASPSASTPIQNIWSIAPSTLKRLRSCDLQLITTSSMLGVTDPRNMISSDWTLARQIRQDLTALSNVSNLTLEAKALGDPLWNPLWIWYHACQSFKNMGTPLADTTPVGPKLNRMTFSLDTWSPGENYMERDAARGGAWTWYCMKGHSVGVDGAGDVTVREFCGKLYQVCRACRPESEDEEWDEAGED